MKLRRLLALLVAPLSLLLGSPFVGTAHATHVTCNMLVNTSIVFDSNVGPCALDGLIANADNITIDLNGYQLFGTSGPTSVNDAGVGVRISGHKGVVVTSSVAGGQIHHFDAGVAISGNTGTGNTVSSLNIHDNFSENPTGADNGEGVSISTPQADNNTVQNNQIVNNGPFAGVSIYGGTSTDQITGTTLTGNTIRDNSQSSQTAGVRAENWTYNSTFANNVVRNNAFDGFSIFADTQNITMSGNTVTGNGNHGDPTIRPGDGIHLFARTSNHTVTTDTVNRNGGNGIALDGPVGTAAGANNNTVTSNTALNNGVADAIIITVPPVIDIRVHRLNVVLGGMELINLPSGFPFYDLKDANVAPPCDSNTWSANTYGTRNQTCIN